MPEESQTMRYSKEDWDEIRLSFATSLMVDTHLLSLSQNLEIEEWPLKGSNETPSKYIDFTWEELQELPGLADQPERVDLLVHILRETQAFDDPFGDMVATVDAHASVDRTLEKNIIRLKISPDFPMRLSGLSADTQAFCKNEDIRTLKDFGHFAQNMAQNIVIGGDFRALLNALTTEDQQTLKKYIPFRPGSLGLHLPECVGMLLNQLSDVERSSLLKKFGYSLTRAEESAARLTKEQLIQLEDILQTKAKEICDYFPEQYKQLWRDVKGGKTLERIFMVVDDPAKETICVQVMSRYIRENVVADDAPQTESGKKGGFFSRWFGKK